MKQRPLIKKLLLVGLPALAVLLIAAIVLVTHKSEAPTMANRTSEGQEATNDQSRLNALQRNARNTAAQTDANILMTAVLEYAANNSGKLPESLEPISNGVKLCGMSCAGANGTTAEFKQYEVNNDTVGFRTYEAGLQVTDTSKLYIVYNATCDNDTVVAGSNRSVAVLYALVGANGATPKCLAS